jgi:hypothetical protein
MTKRPWRRESEYPSDLAVVRSIEPATLDLVEWIRATGRTAPTNVAGKDQRSLRIRTSGTGAPQRSSMISVTSVKPAAR